MYDLKSEDPEEPGLPDEYHGYQPLLLRHTFKPTNCDPDEVFIGADINLYYDLRHLNWYKRPDWFAVVGVSRLYEGGDLRNSYVMWQELVSPFVVVELLSPGTEDEDLGRTVRQLGKPPTKWQVYEQILRVPYYFVFSRYTNELQAFRLVGGAYESLEVGDKGLLIAQLGLRLGLWQGRYENIERLWLRWFTASGELILTPSEEAVTAQARVAQAEQRAERLAAKLRELNIDPDELE
jgi:Uma2 family endonuclease